MTPLDQIIDAAINDGEDVPRLLRLCRALAVDLDSDPFKGWIKWEQSGYPEDVSLPSYRVWNNRLSAVVRERLDSWVSVSRWERRTKCSEELPEGLRVSEHQCREPVSILQRQVAELGDTQGRAEDRPDLLEELESRASFDSIERVQQWVRTADLILALDAVRDRVVDVASALKQADPDAGTDPGFPRLSRSAVRGVVEEVLWAGRAGDTYLITGQVGAAGPHATASGNTFRQVPPDTDLDALAVELRTLAAALRDQAGGDEELGKAAGVVEAAAGMAAAGEREQAAGLMSRVGSRVLEFAEKASVGTAVHVLKHILGV